MEIVVEIINKRGLHARAAAKFVKTVTAYDVPVSVTKIGDNSSSVGGSSILGLMMLGADPGSKLCISSDSTEVLDALKELIENRFGENE